MNLLARWPWIDLVRSGNAVWCIARLGAWLLAGRLLGQPRAPAEIGARLRKICERMGVTYVKLGQFLAIRSDLLDPELASELSKLFDAVPPVADGDMRRVVEEEFGQSRETVFAEFDPQCIAAASIAQVHRARLHGGEIVAVKIQRPLVLEKFAADIRFFRACAWIVDHLFPLGAISLADGIGQFEQYTLREMDFVEEARTLERAGRTTGRHDAVPQPFWRFTRRRVLTMELETGVPLSTVIRLVERNDRVGYELLLPGVAPATIVRHIADASFRQIFDEGYFHADPHPGNIFVRTDSTVVFVDFGIHGHLTAWELDTLSHFVAAAAVGNTASCLHYFSKLLIIKEGTDVGRLKRDLGAVIYRWQAAVQDIALPPEQRHFGRYVNEFFNVVRRHGTAMSLESLLFWRTLVALNGTALRVDTETDVLALLGSFFARRRLAMFWQRVSGVATALGAQDALKIVHVGASKASLRCEKQSGHASRFSADRHAKWGAGIIASLALVLILVLAR